MEREPGRDPRGQYPAVERAGRRRGVAALLVAAGFLGASAAAVGGSGAVPGASVAGARSASFEHPARSMSTNRALSTNSGKSKSLDWAGYAVTGTNLQSVSGSWKQPVVKCPVNQVQQASFWVGLDGFAASDPTVEQIGTDSDCTKVAGKTSGTPNYYAWYELYPQSVVFLPKGSYPVAPGNTIGAHVAHVGTKYTLTISNVSRWTFAITITPSTPPLNSSAEWIVEAPCSGSTSTCTVLPLANFGTIPFSGGTVDGSSISTSGLAVHQITMTTASGTVVKALPSALNPLGAAFSVTWKHN